MLNTLRARFEHFIHSYKWYSPLSLFHIVFFIIFFVTVPFFDWFLGWDALSPELNFGVNFSRAFSAMWQENYGLGVLGGHGFAATLPHTAIIYLLSFIIPQMLLRAIFTLLCFYLGGLGMYLLVRQLLMQLTISNFKFQISNSYIALFSSFFYMGNLGTIQMFYVPLEAFTTQFAALPWLFLSIYAVLERPTARRLLVFLLINILASIQGFIPSLFIAYSITLVLFLTIYMIQNFSRSTLWRSFLVLFFTGIANCYWLVPLVYFQLTRSSIFINAYNNLISTPHFVNINKKYGNVIDVGLLKGFMFDSFELGGQTMGAWATHQNNPLISFIGITLFALSVFGLIIACVYLRRWKGLAFAGVFLFFFVSLTTATPPFSYFTDLMQQISPTYYQAFRTSFTKFSIGLAFSYSIFLSIGLLYLIRILHFKFQISNFKFILIGAFTLLFLYTLPLFSGNLIYSRLVVDLPKPYTQIMDYFRTQPDGRIADFPQDCSEGWFAYNWGYFGSGFYWYGIKQPILARSFDVWSNTNENYYWEITQALKQQNYTAVEAVLDKYQVSWVLYDPNLLFCRNQRPFLLHQDFIQALQKSPNFTLVKTFKDTNVLPIQIFERKKPVVKDLVGVFQNLPTITPSYEWTDNDTAFQTIGNYISPPTENGKYLYFPYRSLFTKRPDMLPLHITAQNDQISFRQTVPTTMKDAMISIPPYNTLENVLPTTISFEPQTATTTDVYLVPHFPTITIGKNLYTPYPSHIQIGSVPTASLPTLSIQVNGQTIASPSSTFTTHIPTTLFLSLSNTITALSENGSTLFSWSGETDPQLTEAVSTAVTIPLSLKKNEKVAISISSQRDPLFPGYVDIADMDTLSPAACNNTDKKTDNTYEIGREQGGEFIELSSQNSSLCLNMNLPDVPTDIGYLAFLTSQNISGDPLRFAILNKNRGLINDTYLSDSKERKTQSLIIPPTFPKELGFAIQLDNISENDEKTVNTFAGLSLYPIPYNLLTNIVISNQGATVQATPAKPGTDLYLVSHPNATYYSITFPRTYTLAPSTSPTLVLSQSFDPMWKAYVLAPSTYNLLPRLFPFLFGKELENHVLVNNWENGWQLPNQSVIRNSQFVIIYLPQYLQYCAYLILLFVLLVLSVLSVIAWKPHKKS